MWRLRHLRDAGFVPQWVGILKPILTEGISILIMAEFDRALCVALRELNEREDLRNAMLAAYRLGGVEAARQTYRMR